MGKVNISFFFLILISVISLATPQELFSQKEDTAHLKFEKTAISKKEANIPYIVKKGDWIANIIRKQLGTNSYTDIAKALNKIRQLNPDIKNLNRIYDGQKLIIPEFNRSKEANLISNNYVTKYKVKKGDSIYWIMRNKFNTEPSETSKTLRLIKSLNPQLKKADVIYPGQIIQFPTSSQGIAGSDQGDGIANIPQEQQEIGKEKPAILAGNRLAIIKQVIEKMKGSLITSGYHYIPLPQIGQFTIDCLKIPVVEYDDGSTILLDFNNRLPDPLKKMIQTSWKNYRIINYSNKDDIAIILQKTINSSKSYTMSKMVRPFSIGTKPQVQIHIDWLISKKTFSGSSQYLQGVSFPKDTSQLLPQRLVNYAEKNGLIITEIIEKYGVAKPPDLKNITSSISNLNAANNKDLIHSLLATIGYTPKRDMDVKIYDQTKDGFNLSIKVDFLMKKDNRQLIIHSKKLPQQFIDILKSGGSEIIFYESNEQPRLLIEKVLRTMNVPFSFDHFSFSIPNMGLQRALINFPALKIMNDAVPLFMIDFDMDYEIYSLLQGIWRLNIVKY